MAVINTPDNEGVTHINIYTKSKSRLGRLLSNLSNIPIVHPKHGCFKTVEGYWFWLSTGMQHDVLRTLSGHQARAFGKTLDKVLMDEEVFQEHIIEAFWAKVTNSDTLRDLLKGSKDLELTHYYAYGHEKSWRIITPPGHGWQLTAWNDIRAKLQNT